MSNVSGGDYSVVSTGCLATNISLDSKKTQWLSMQLKYILKNDIEEISPKNVIDKEIVNILIIIIFFFLNAFGDDLKIKRGLQ